MYDLFNQPLNKPIDFPIVSAQNNPASTEHYEKMAKHFGKQRWTILKHLQEGNILTRRIGLVDLGIADPIKRKDELKKQFGAHISDKWDSPEHNYMIWFCSESDKIHNNNLIKKAG